MRSEDLQEYLNKKIKLVLLSGSVFTGTITKVTEDSIHMIDKFDQSVVINIDQISNIFTLNGGSR